MTAHEYEHWVKTLTIEQLGSEIFSVAKRNDTLEQWKVHILWSECCRRDLKNNPNLKRTDL